MLKYVLNLFDFDPNYFVERYIERHPGQKESAMTGAERLRQQGIKRGEINAKNRLPKIYFFLVLNLC